MKLGKEESNMEIGGKERIKMGAKEEKTNAPGENRMGKKGQRGRGSGKEDSKMGKSASDRIKRGAKENQVR